MHIALVALMYAFPAAADLYYTERALRLPGVYELNPFGQSSGVRIGVKTALTAWFVWLDHRLQKGGHHAVKWVMRVIVIGAWGTAAYLNSRIAGGAKP